MRALVQRLRNFVMGLGSDLSPDERARLVQRAAEDEHQLQQFVGAASQGDFWRAERIRRNIREELDLMRTGKERDT